MIPPGFERCAVCGEFNGSTQAKHLNWEGAIPEVARDYLSTTEQAELLELKRSDYDRRDPERVVSVTCLCRGIPCRVCGKNKVHRPISNSYEEETNTVGHWFYLAGLIPCAACKQAESVAQREKH